jgi:hypothetical protein
MVNGVQSDKRIDRRLKTVSGVKDGLRRIKHVQEV